MYHGNYTRILKLLQDSGLTVQVAGPSKIMQGIGHRQGFCESLYIVSKWRLPDDAMVKKLIFNRFTILSWPSESHLYLWPDGPGRDRVRMIPSGRCYLRISIDRDSAGRVYVQEYSEPGELSRGRSRSGSLFMSIPEIEFKKWFFFTFVSFTILDVVSTIIDLFLIPGSHELNPLLSWSLPSMITFKLFLIPVLFFVLFLMKTNEPKTTREQRIREIGNCSSFIVIFIFAAVVVHNFFLLGIWVGETVWNFE